MTLRTKALLMAALLLSACSTEKAKWANVQYHNTTCHYNVWWNGNESLKAGRLKLVQSVVDDYTQFLPVEKLGSESEGRAVAPEMDRAIEKGVKGIKKHSIVVKGEEHVPYIKECYLLTAYATFYEHDYVSTVNTCNILVSQFPGTRAGDEGAVLLARCMSAEKRYVEAEGTLDQLVQRLAQGNFVRSERGKLYMAMVEATVPQEKYKKAVEYIHQALEAGVDRASKARLTFLMAQIYQHLDKRPVAAKYYHEVLGFHPEYVMEFNAKLGEASCADLEHSDVRRLERQLDDMADDKKNEEFRDQIYYAKGEMYLGLKDAQKACDNFRRSVAVSTVNRAQKAKSALRLGDVLYDLYQDYDQAQRYYDTAMQVITRDYPRYGAIKRRYDMLTELTSYTRVYERCDSLLAVAAMPEAERMTLIQAKIDTLASQEQRAKEQALLRELQNETRAMQNTLKGDWYFYNSSTVQKGRDAFRQKWGMRPLEDYWFLSHREMLGSGMVSGLDDEEKGGEEPSSDTASAQPDTLALAKAKGGNPDDPHDVAYYLKDLPTSQHQLDSIDSLTATNLLNAGYIFYDGVGNVDRALECYLRMANDYTVYGEVIQAFYMLYRIFDRQGNTPQANYYRDMVLMGFPDSDFANLIRDNEYYKELLRREHRVDEDYAELYDLFFAGRFRGVVEAANAAEQQYGARPELGRFRYWKALAQARLGERDTAIATLEHLIAQAPARDSIVPLAEAQLELLRDGAELAGADTGGAAVPLRGPESQVAPDDQLPESARVFRYRENQQYYVVVVINDRTVKATDLQYRLADFNSLYYSNKGYKVNASLFTDTTQLLTIHRFVSDAEAMVYFRQLQGDDSPLRQLADSDHTEFVISTQNYATFYNRKDVEAYMAFFRKYYLNKKQ